jgi:hypothetical protein
MIRGLLVEAAASGDVRDDVSPHELATYCIHAVAAARSLPSKAAIGRLVSVILDGVHPNARSGSFASHPTSGGAPL